MIILLCRQVYRNGEVVRTCHSAANKIPGMYASVNNATDPVTGEIQGVYLCNGSPECGVSKSDRELYDHSLLFVPGDAVQQESRLGLVAQHGGVEKGTE
jgi:hypothetical protein